jgi:rubrerythrin
MIKIEIDTQLQDEVAIKISISSPADDDDDTVYELHPRALSDYDWTTDEIPDGSIDPTPSPFSETPPNHTCAVCGNTYPVTQSQVHCPNCAAHYSYRPL